jgi:hypothetical protein
MLTTMLTIRDAQMKVFGQLMQRQFEARMLQRLRSAYAACLGQRSDHDILSLIRDGIARSERFEVVRERDVARFIEYMVIYGADFDQSQAWAAEILSTPGINGAQKMARIDDCDLFTGRGGLG